MTDFLMHLTPAEAFALVMVCSLFALPWVRSRPDDTPPDAGVDEFGGVEVDRDTDGELLIDWSPGQGRMVTLSLRADGRLSYAFTWDDEKAHGTAQMPPAAGVPACECTREEAVLCSRECDRTEDPTKPAAGVTGTPSDEPKGGA